MLPMTKPDLSKLLFCGSLFLGVFGYGLAAGRYELFPFPLVQYAKGSLDQVIAERDTLLGLRPTWLLEAARYEGDGVTRLSAGQAFPGLTLMSGFFDNDLEIRLVRLDGTVANRWPLRFHEIFPDTSHIQPPELVPQTDWNTGVQGARALRDGSVVFNFEGLGTAKLDRCGAVQWTLPRMTHHSVDLSEDGTFWIPGTRYVGGDSPFPVLKPPYDEDTLLHVSADGRVLQEISVLGLLFENDLEAVLFANGRGGVDLPQERNITHLNDIEELTPAMAPHFPQFAAGDLILSLRNYNLVLVVDPRTRKVKWHQTGPWLKQHDPDFEPNGRISVFSNNTDGTDTGALLGGSTIIEIDPRTRATSVEYGHGPNQRLFTKYRGKHQRLPNGNEVIVESHAGRVLEINDRDEIVWEFVNRYDDDSVAIVAGATRYPEGYFARTDWTCP